MCRLWNNRWVRLAVGLAISLLLLYLAFRGTSFAAVWAILRRANLAWVLAGLGCVALNNLLKTWRWGVMLGPPGKKVSFTHLLMSNLSGQMLNAVTPVRLGDLSRAYVTGGEGPGRMFTLGTVALEKIVDLLCLALLFLLMLLLIPLPGWINPASLYSAWGLVAAGVVMGGLTFLMAAQRGRFLRLAGKLTARLPEKQRAKLLGWLHSGLDSLDVLQQRGDLIKIAGLSAFVWLAALLTNQCILLALGIHLGFTASLLVLVAVMVGITVAATPGRIGVFEWACVLALSVFGVDQAQALSYGLLLHAIVYIPMMLAGLVSFLLLPQTIRPAASRED